MYTKMNIVEDRQRALLPKERRSLTAYARRHHPHMPLLIKVYRSRMIPLHPERNPDGKIINPYKGIFALAELYDQRTNILVDSVAIGKGDQK